MSQLLTPRNSQKAPSVVSAGQRKSGRSLKVKNPYSPSNYEVATPKIAAVPTAVNGVTDGVPPPSRFIAERSLLQETLEIAMCRKCKGKLEFTYHHLGVSTIPTLRCTRDSCGYSRESSNPIPDSDVQKKTNHVRLTDNPVNTLFVLAFLTVGDGGTEAQRLLGLLDMPNLTTMAKSSFTRIERDVAPSIIAIAEQAMFENLVAEVRASTDNPPDFDVDEWLAAVKNKDPNYPLNKYAKIRGSTDMGWQKRGSGFDSMSGHSLFFGAEDRTPIHWIIKSKYCRFCSLSKGSEPVKEHVCVVNHDGSAASMESLAVVDMLHSFHDEFKTHLSMIITDDDSKMKANCRWSNQDYEAVHGHKPFVIDKDGKRKVINNIGKLKLPIPQPRWGSDLNHRCKTVRLKLKKLQRKVVKETCGMLEVDTLRLSTNFAYMARTLSTLDKAEFVKYARAVYKHHFDNHEDCTDFCQRKDESIDDRQNSNKFYRDMVKDHELYVAVSSIIDEYITQERLEEISHGYDTNCNESMNSIIQWLAPKNKTFSGSTSLKTRIAIGISVQTLGFECFFRLLFQRLGLAIPDGTDYWLKKMDTGREERKEKKKTLSSKRKRKEKYYDKLKTKTEQARKDIARGTGYYAGSGACLDTEAGKKKRKKANGTSGTCRCGSTSHSRTNHSLCPLNKVYRGAADESVIAVLEDDRSNQAFMDTLGPSHEEVAKRLLPEDDDENDDEGSND